jgi:hypothetical protein
MANALTLTAAALPAANVSLALGVASGANSNGDNSAGWTFAGGASGAGDTIANAELLKGVATTSRLYSFLSQSYATQAALDAALAAVNASVTVNSGTSFRFITAAPGVPTATVTTAAATGALTVRIGYSASN